MASKKRGAKKPVKGEKEVYLEKEESNIDGDVPVFKDTVYSIDNKQKLTEVPAISISQPEQEVVKESPVVESSEQKKPMRKEIKVLVILVIILLIVDVLSLYLYYKPDLSRFFKFRSGEVVDNDSEKCNDGTAYNSCSKNKPYYCYEGQLIKKAATCGCPNGYQIDFQDCKKIV